MARVRQGLPFFLPLFVFLPFLYFLIPILSAPADKAISALAPVEIVAAGFREPAGVVVDEDGAIFVSDRRAGEVFKITTAGVQSLVADLKRPVGLAFDPDRRLLIVDEGRGRLLRLEASGSLHVVAQGMKKPRWVAAAEDGTIYLTAKGLKSDREEDDEDEEEGEVILRLNPQGSLFTIFADGFKGLQGLVVHESNIFVAAKGLKNVRREGVRREEDDHGGIFKIPILSDGNAVAIARFARSEIKKPVGLIRDILGAFYVSTEEVRLQRKHEEVIGKVGPEGTLTLFASGLKKPLGLALDRLGNLYVADDRGDHKGRIVRFRAPPAPNLVFPSFTNQTPLTIQGTTEPDSRIDAFLNDAATPITVSTKDGNFSLTLNPTPNAQNLLAVFTTAHGGNGLTSAAAEFTIVHDNIAPLISGLTPGSGSFLKNPRPLIRADFSDNLSGVDASRVQIRLDNFDVTGQAKVTASGFAFTPLTLLSEGSHTVSVTIFDRAGNSASASSTFTIDVTPPVIANLTPADGTVVTTARPQISARFNDNLSGVNAASVRVFLDGAEVTSQATVSATGFTLDLSNPLTQGPHTVSVSVSDRAGNLASAASTFAVSLGPQLNPIGNKTVNLGETLTFTVTATHAGGGPVSLFVAPLPLPNHATFNAATGLFTFTPDTTQVGSFSLTFTAVSDGQSASETITITVPAPPPDGVTGVRGRIDNLNQTPLGNVRVTLKSSGHTAFSGADGFFTLSGVPSGRQELIINGREANLGVFAILAVPVDLIAGVLNHIASPITLPDVDVAAEVPVSPTFTTVVANPHVPGVELTIPGGTARNSDGTLYTGKLSINPVPDYGRPESRPEELRPGMAITIQPAGVRFNPPARLTFPNADGMVPGSELDLWSLSPDTGTFSIVGKGVVAADGLSVITVEGGVTASAWHFFLANSPRPGDASNGTIYCASGNCFQSSEINLLEGSLFLSHALSSYRSLGQSRSLSLTYSSVTAEVKPIVSLDTTLSVRAAVPNTYSTRLEVGGVQQGGEVFTDTRSLPEDQDSTSRLSVQFDAGNLSTGRYPYQATVFSNYLNSSIGGITSGNVIVFNRKTSPLGSGWAITDLQQLHLQAEGALLTTGGGIALFFSGGPDTFNAPAGELSILARNPDGSFTRTLKDGTKINFNAQGLQTSLADRNGNTTTYSYDAGGRLLTITDPAGLITTFTYSGGRLQKITDPAGRETLFQHDAQGNLTRITNPDKSFVSYAYNAQGHLTQFTDERANTTSYAYDFAGRFSRSTRPTGETRALNSSRLQGLADTASGQGTPLSPVPVVRSENATASMTDGKGQRTTFTLDPLGQIASQRDALGNVTSMQRDSNGLPTRITRPNGAVTTMTYDTRGNLLTSTDPVGARTTFTYEPSFNQVTSIRDPKGNLTTITYDLKGNPTEITDALGNKTQMTYDARGLLTSVTSAVGTPQQNTTGFTYDLRGNLTTTTDPLGNITTLDYDSAGNVIRSTDSEGRVTEFTYDALNRLVSVLDPNLQVTRYTYDQKGNLTEVIDAKLQRTSFNYDRMDRLTSATNPLGFTESFVYDANGNLTSTTTRNGQLISFDYDALNRLIKKTRPPTSTEVGPQPTTFTYDSVGNLLSVVNPMIGVFNQYNLANRLISSTSAAEEEVAGRVIQINADAVIGENNFQFEGRTIQVNGRTLTVNGFHTFANLILANGAVLTHSPTTATKVNRLDIKVTGTLTVDTTSRIDVTGRGFLGGNQIGNPLGGRGMTLGFVAGSSGRSGASYGGLGGALAGTANPVYGDFRNPNEPGSGGASENNGGGNGGGIARIVAQTLRLDGSIKADGGNTPAGFCCNGGGSGGAIRIDVGTLTGTGTISVNGGNADSQGGGGGGGRVAVYYQNSTGFDLSRITAFGGISSATSNAGAGTVYLQGPARENGELIVDNNNVAVATLSTPIPNPASGSISLTHLRVRRQGRVRIDSLLNLTGTLEVAFGGEFISTSRTIAETINLNNNGLITHLPTTASAFFKVDLSANSVIIDLTSRIYVTGRGFLGGGQPGNPFTGGRGMTVGFTGGSAGTSGGGYGGLGGVSGTSPSTNPVYGDFRNPNEVGSGGAVNTGFGVSAGNGGGLIRIVAQTLTLNGAIRADGGSICCWSGGGSGGGIRIDVGSLSGTGQISANGGNGTTSFGSGGGGGGRIAIYYQNAAAFDLGRATAVGGAGSDGGPNGGAGTVYLQGPARESGELIVDNNNRAVPTLSTPIPNPAGGSISLTHLRVRRQARVRIDSFLNLTGTLEVSSGTEFISTNRTIAGTINLNNNGLITHLPTTATAFFKVDLSAGTLTIDATSRIDVTARGFLGGGQPGNPFGGGRGMTVGFQGGSTGTSGGSYGGLGGSAGGGSANPLYGTLQDPKEPGSGGAVNTGFGVSAGNGGGLVRIVAQTLTLNGAIRADGGSICCWSGGGSGGGIRMDVGSLSGTGQISANGGNGTTSFGSGGGGGGRIAIYYQNAAAFDLGRATAVGGAGSNGGPNGQNGTVHLQQQIAMLTPTDSEAPVMHALSGVEGKADIDSTTGESVRLASSSSFILHPSSFAQTVPDFQALIAKLQSETPQVPQRIVFSPSDLDTRNSKLDTQHTNLYLAMVAEKAESRARETSTNDDFDPIYTYDLNGNRVSMIDPTGLTTYTYDALNRLTSITNNRGFTTSFTYDALGRRTSMTHGNKVVTTYQYDAASQLLSLVHQLGATTVNSFTYTYDRVGNRKTKADNNGTHTYTYDTLNRLVEAVNPLPSNPLETYNYDPVGNRTNSNQNGASVFNQANQLLEDANFTYQYDNNGNLTRKTAKVGGPLTSYEYDAENKLTRVVSNGTVADYRYDGLGRRVEKQVTQGPTTNVTRFIYDNEDILLELDTQNSILARYTHGPGFDEPLVMEKGGASFFYHADGLGSITEVTDSTGAIKQRYTYSSFGKIESQLDPNFIQPYTYTSREFDLEIGLYYYRARYYDSSTGRFLQEDPFRVFLHAPLSLNLYPYVTNNPINYLDPTGLWKWYGNWGGPNWTGGQEGSWNTIDHSQAYWPMDKQDECYRDHDKCFGSCRKLFCSGSIGRASCFKGCDRELARCLANLGNDPSNNWRAKAARRFFERSNPRAD